MKKKYHFNFVHFDNDWFTIRFVYFKRNVLKDEELKCLLEERKFSLKDINISARVLNSWYKNSILDDNRLNGKGWSKFNVSEFIWIKIVEELRQFGFDLKKIRRVKSALEDSENRDYNSKFKIFDFYISVILNQKIPIKLLVFSNGETAIARESAINSNLQDNIFDGSYISIDFNRLITILNEKTAIKTDYLNHSLSTIEKEISQDLNNDKINSVSIKKTNKHYLVEKEHIFQTRKEASQLTNSLSYVSSTEQKVNNKSIFKVVEQKRIKGKPQG